MGNAHRCIHSIEMYGARDSMAMLLLALKLKGLHSSTHHSVQLPYKRGMDTFCATIPTRPSRASCHGAGCRRVTEHLRSDSSEKANAWHVRICAGAVGWDDINESSRGYVLINALPGQAVGKATPGAPQINQASSRQESAAS